MNKFYKTTFKLVILSEEPISDINLEDIPRFVNEEDGVLYGFEVSKEKELTGKQAVKLLNHCGSEPGFFRLDKMGNKIDE